MRNARKLLGTLGPMIAASAVAQVPDMMTALDAGGRALGAGSALNATGVSTLSATNNPAGLAFVSRRQIGLAARTYETSRTTVTGALNDLRLNTKTEGGDGYRGTHIGFALPLKGGPGRHNVLGIAWTVGGWFNDIQSGSNLANGIASYLDFTRAQTDFFNISFGTTNESQNLALGFGLVLAQQNVRNFNRVTFTDNNTLPQISDTDTTGTGVGVQAGLMLTPRENSNMTLAVTARTPIKVKHSGSPLSLYEKVPGRIAGGIALRRDGFRGGRDFLILAGEVQHFFGGESSPRLDRQNQTTGHVGLEYSYSRGNATFPIRLGYSLVPSGGEDFDSRNSFTYGIGYHPNHGDWLIEVNFGRPESGGREASVFVTWRFGK